ncbi:MAG: glycosyltransferase [Dehalococcoidia bacterium]
MRTDPLSIALVSVHGCPLARLGERDTGGMNVYLLQLAKELGERGIRADVFTRYHDPKDPQAVELGPNARVIHIEAGSWHETKNDIYPLLPEFVDNMVRFQESNGLEYDVYHSHYWLSGQAVSMLNNDYGIPHVASFHTLGEAKVRARPAEVESDLRIRSERAILNRADQIVAVSEHERLNMIDYYDASPDKIRVIPCGVDMDTFRPRDKDESRRELGIGDSKVLLFVGRVQPLKGPELLLRAVANLKNREGLRLLIVGGDEEGDAELNQLRKLAQELGITHMVTFEGIVQQKRLPLYYNAADVCIVPSYYESFGLVAAEALACGTPVIAARVGGLRETVTDGVNGYLIPSRSPEAFAERIDLLLDNDYLCNALGARARTSVQRLAWPIVADQIVTLYGSLALACN